MSNVSLIAAPVGVWKSGRTLVATVFNAATQSVGVVGSVISAGAAYATAFEHTAMIDGAITVLTHRDNAVHNAALSMVANKKSAHAARGIKASFDETKCYTDCVAILETKIPG